VHVFLVINSRTHTLQGVWKDNFRNDRWGTVEGYCFVNSYICHFIWTESFKLIQRACSYVVCVNINDTYKFHHKNRLLDLYRCWLYRGMIFWMDHSPERRMAKNIFLTRPYSYNLRTALEANSLTVSNFYKTYGLHCFVTNGVGTVHPSGAPEFIPCC
jgi:hypothetical protein